MSAPHRLGPNHSGPDRSGPDHSGPDHSGPDSREKDASAAGRGGRWRVQPRLVVTCAVVWVLLWGHLSVANLLVGALLGVLIGLVFRLPPIAAGGRVRPLGVLKLAGRLAIDLVGASVGVIATVFRFGSTPRNAIIRVRLRSRSDLYLSQTAELASLVPGSLVLEARRSTGTLYLHVMDVRGPADLERARADVLAAEERVIRALGTSAEIAALRRGDPLPLAEETR